MKNSLKEITSKTKTTFTLNIEKPVSVYLYNLLTAIYFNPMSIDEMTENISRCIIGRGYKCGHGGSHVWISDEKNNRVAVLYSYELSDEKANNKIKEN